MRKRLLAFFATVLMFLFTGGMASAALVVNMYGDADGFGIGATSGNPFIWSSVGSTPDAGTITDQWMYGTKSWTQTYSLAGLGSITSATLDIFAGGVGALGPGSASVYVDSSLVGTLTVGDGGYLGLNFPLNNIAWLDSFDLMPYLSAVSDGSIDVSIQFSITGDGWTLDYSKLTLSDSAPVPEPSTMMLLGSGLVGLLGYRRRRFKK